MAFMGFGAGAAAAFWVTFIALMDFMGFGAGAAAAFWAAFIAFMEKRRRIGMMKKLKGTESHSQCLLGQTGYAQDMNEQLRQLNFSKRKRMNPKH